MPNMEQLAMILGGEVGRLPTIYLGMPLGAKSKSKGIWDSGLEKCEKKFDHVEVSVFIFGGKSHTGKCSFRYTTNAITLPNSFRCCSKTRQDLKVLLMARKQGKKSFPPSQMEGDY